MALHSESEWHWGIVAESHDALSLVALRLTASEDVRSFRLTCQAARDAVDEHITSITLELNQLKASDSEDRGYLDQNSIIPENNTTAVAEIQPAPAVVAPVELANGDGDVCVGGLSVCNRWHRVFKVCIVECTNSKLLQSLVTELSEKLPAVRELQMVKCALNGSRAHPPLPCTLSACEESNFREMAGVEEGTAVLLALTSRPWGALEVLELSECGLSEEGLEILASLEAPLLCDVDLSGNAFQSIDPLVSQVHRMWPSLRTLDLGSLLLRVPEALSSLAAGFPQLEHLDLWGSLVERRAMLPRRG